MRVGRPTALARPHLHATRSPDKRSASRDRHVVNAHLSSGRLRREPRQYGGMAHRAVPPSAPGMNHGAGDDWRVATRQLPHRSPSVCERMPSMACLRHIPALPRLSALQGRGFALCTLRERGRGCWAGTQRRRNTYPLPNPSPGGRGAFHAANRSSASTRPEDVVPRGYGASGTWMCCARVLEQDAEPRDAPYPLGAAAPTGARAPNAVAVARAFAFGATSHLRPQLDADGRHHPGPLQGPGDAAVGHAPISRRNRDPATLTTTPQRQSSSAHRERFCRIASIPSHGSLRRRRSLAGTSFMVKALAR